jgi:pimeloyl-ACP methyl ester carboxylesterase
MATFVLVHGAWHGGWCWVKLARLLTDAAHTVYAPTLTGLGDRAHLARPENDLALHVEDVVAMLEAEELRNVILVGHGYGGLVVGGAAAGTPGRVARLVYVDAFVAEAGKALLDHVGPERADEIRKAAASAGDGWRVAPLPPERLGVTSARDTEWLKRRLVPQPLRTFEQPVAAVPPAKLARTYVHCSKPAMAAFAPFAERIRDDNKWRFHDVKSGHDAMVTAPGELAKILMAEAKA